MTGDRAGELSDFLLSLQAEFKWELQAERFEILEHWERERSGSRFYRMAGSPDGPEVIVKIVADWEPQDAERMFHAMDDLAETIEVAAIESGRAVRPLAWAGDPAQVVMPYISGTDLVTILRQPDHQAWDGYMNSWMTRAGGMLAAFHARHLTQPRDDISSAGDEARELAARLRIEGPTVERILNDVDWRHRCARSFGDIGPGNLLGTPEGDLYLLDPPSTSPTALIHRDLGNFIFELRRQLAGRGFTKSRPVSGRFHQLRAAFLSGYFAVWHEEPLGPGDEALIALFEMRRAIGMARRRFPGRPGDAAWFAGSALARRREIRLAAAQS